jgi:predicted DNA-binding antitoxin AbrB/MazE fold protein
MTRTIPAVYENGVLRPLEALDLAEKQRVEVTIAAIGVEKPSVNEDIAAYFEPEEWEASKHDDISLAEVRRALSSIPGSLSDAVVESREERF